MKTTKTTKILTLILALAILLLIGLNMSGRENTGLSESGRAGRKSDNAIRILGIGNSFTVDALNDYLHKLAASDGRQLIVAHLTVGGATLEEHADNARSNRPVYQYLKRGVDGVAVNVGGKSIEEAVSDEKWNYIIFQQQSWLSGQFDSYEEHLPELAAIVKSKSPNPEASYALIQTWAFAYDYPYSDYDYYDHNQQTMHKALVEAADKAAALVSPKLTVIPVGTAIQNGRTSLIGDKFCLDGYHLNRQIGRFTAACVIYEAVTGGKVVENKYMPPDIPQNQARIAKQAADSAMTSPNLVTDMSDFK